MPHAFCEYLDEQIIALKKEGFYKSEHVISSPQDASVTLQSGQSLLNFCANNYLGLANDPRVIASAQEALKRYGYGVASVRFICGTQSIHKQLEETISDFLGTEDTILYSSCFDANGGIFETLLGEQDAVISDELNHASIIDGIRLCKAQRYRYKNNNLHDLELQLQAADQNQARFKLIVTDGVFSMDGIIADLAGICALAARYNALVMVDDSHAVGFIGEQGRGTPERCGVADKVDIYTGTLGKALGGASGGYVSGKKAIIEWLRQRSRPYLFSNALAPSIAAASLTVFELLKSEGHHRRAQLHANAHLFRSGMAEAGFQLISGEHPIIPIMLNEAIIASKMAAHMREAGVYVTAFSFPVVPKGRARIRTQMNAAHTAEDISQATELFIASARKLAIL